MADPASSASVFALMASWFTPSSLFLFVNLVIGTIALTSRFGAPKRQTHQPELGRHNSPPQLARSSSLLDRVRSFNFGLYKHEPTFAETEFIQPVYNSPQLVRTPSFLERVKSFNFDLYKYEPTSAETEHIQPGPPEYENPNLDGSSQLVRTPSLLERVKSFGFGLYNHEPTTAETDYLQPDPPEYENPNTDGSTQPSLARTPSLLERLKSINFSHLHRSDSIKAEKETEVQVDAPQPNPDQHSGHKLRNLVRRSMSEKHAETTLAAFPEKIKKSASEKSASTGKSTETASVGDDDGVDAKADDFINRFKRQLRLQRLDSLLRSREMLKGN